MWSVDHFAEVLTEMMREYISKVLYVTISSSLVHGESLGSILGKKMAVTQMIHLRIRGFDKQKQQQQMLENLTFDISATQKCHIAWF